MKKARQPKPSSFLQNPAITYSRANRHYHRPWMLNGRVRNGNGCGHPGKLTGKLLDLSLVLCHLPGGVPPRTNVQKPRTNPNINW